MRRLLDLRLFSLLRRLLDLRLFSLLRRFRRGRFRLRRFGGLGFFRGGVERPVPSAARVGVPHETVRPGQLALGLRRGRVRVFRVPVLRLQRRRHERRDLLRLRRLRRARRRRSHRGFRGDDTRKRRPLLLLFRGRRGRRRGQLDRLAQELELGGHRLGRRAPLGRALAHRRVSLFLQSAQRVLLLVRGGGGNHLALARLGILQRLLARLQLGAPRGFRRVPRRLGGLGELFVRLAQTLNLLHALLARLAQQRLAFFKQPLLLGVSLFAQTRRLGGALGEQRRQMRLLGVPLFHQTRRLRLALVDEPLSLQRARLRLFAFSLLEPPALGVALVHQPRRLLRLRLAKLRPLQVAFEKHQTLLLVALSRETLLLHLALGERGFALFAQNSRLLEQTRFFGVALAQSRLSLRAKTRRLLVTLADELLVLGRHLAAQTSRLVLQAVRLAAALLLYPGHFLLALRVQATKLFGVCLSQTRHFLARCLRLVRRDGETQTLNLFLRRLRLRVNGAGLLHLRLGLLERHARRRVLGSREVRAELVGDGVTAAARKREGRRAHGGSSALLVAGRAVRGVQLGGHAGRELHQLLLQVIPARAQTRALLVLGRQTLAELCDDLAVAAFEVSQALLRGGRRGNRRGSLRGAPVPDAPHRATEFVQLSLAVRALGGVGARASRLGGAGVRLGAPTRLLRHRLRVGELNLELRESFLEVRGRARRAQLRRLLRLLQRLQRRRRGRGGGGFLGAERGESRLRLRQLLLGGGGALLKRVGVSRARRRLGERAHGGVFVAVAVGSRGDERLVERSVDEARRVRRARRVGEDLLQGRAAPDPLQHLVRPERLPGLPELGARSLGARAVLLRLRARLDAVALRLLRDAAQSLLVCGERLLHVQQVLHLALREANHLARVGRGQVPRVLHGDVAERHGFLRATACGSGRGAQTGFAGFVRRASGVGCEAPSRAPTTTRRR